MTALEVDGLRTVYGEVVALDGASLTLAPGELLAVVGPSGCGKSTLLRTIAGLVDATDGRVVLGGQLVEDGTRRVPPERRAVGLVFQEHALFPHLTVADNVAFGVRGRSKLDVGARVAAMLELVDLPTHGQRFPHELSGGERQRVALARALAPEPDLMLFDEPFASLDRNLRVQLRRDVVQALRATSTASVFVTHDQHEALAIGDRIAVMRRGRIVQIDAPEAVYHRPVDRFVASFMGEASFLPIEVDDSRPTSPLGAVDDVAGPAVAMVRPDDVAFVVDAAGDDEIVAAEYRGSAWLHTVRLGQGPTVLTASSHLDAPEPGTRGHLELVPGHRQVPIPVDGPEGAEGTDPSEYR